MCDLRITSEIINENGVIKIFNNFSILNFSKAKKILHSMFLNDEIKNIVFDLEDLESIDSSGVSVICEAKKFSLNTRNIFIIGNINPHVNAILKNTGIFNLVIYKKTLKDIYV